MKILITAIAAAVLAGCAGQPQLAAVKVPVPVECREQVPSRPAMPTEALRPAESLTTKAKALLAEIELREGYEGRLLAALQACTRPIGPVEGGRRGQ
jgi:type IV pilus biogenesis protein CpaD/CtpE